MKRNHIHYAWVICLMCTLVLFCSYGMTVSTISVYLPYMAEHGGLSQFQASMQPTVRGLASLASMFFVEPFLKKTGVRLGLFLVLVEGAAAFFVYGMADSMIGYTIASVMSGFLFGLAGMVPVSIMISAWFESHRTLALGICAAGSGIASIILPPVITTGIERFSLHGVFFLLAVILLAVGAAAYFCLRNHPGDLQMSPLNTEEKKGVEKKTANVPEREPGKGTELLILINAFLVAVISFGTLPYLNGLFVQAGFDPVRVSFAYSCYGISTMLCKLLYGHITDRIGSDKSYVPFHIAYIIGILLCCFSGAIGYPVVMLIMLLHGLGMPLTTVGIPVYAGDISTKESFPKKLRTTQMVFMAGSIAAGPITGMAAELTGTYTLAFGIHAVLGMAGFICTAAAYRNIMRMRREIF